MRDNAEVACQTHYLKVIGSNPIPATNFYTMPKEKKFPTSPDDQGWFFNSEEEHLQGIRSKKYDNGSEIKEVTLKNGRTAVIRKLKGRDFVETKKQIQSDSTLDFETANMSVAVTFDGKQEPPEYYLDDLFQDDYSTLMIAYGSLNFQ